MCRQVDAAENPEVTKAFGVSGYPTLKFFKLGNVIDYKGGRTESVGCQPSAGRG